MQYKQRSILCCMEPHALHLCSNSSKFKTQAAQALKSLSRAEIYKFLGQAHKATYLALWLQSGMGHLKIPTLLYWCTMQWKQAAPSSAKKSLALSTKHSINSSTWVTEFFGQWTHGALSNQTKSSCTRLGEPNFSPWAIDYETTQSLELPPALHHTLKMHNERTNSREAVGDMSCIQLSRPKLTTRTIKLTEIVVLLFKHFWLRYTKALKSAWQLEQKEKYTPGAHCRVPIHLIKRSECNSYYGPRNTTLEAMLCWAIMQLKWFVSSSADNHPTSSKSSNSNSKMVEKKREGKKRWRMRKIKWTSWGRLSSLDLRSQIATLPSAQQIKSTVQKIYRAELS